jgi:hypothetical protein
MHAPVVLQHYLVSMNSQKHIPKLDISAFLKRNMDPFALERYMWYDEGGDSRAFLFNILKSAKIPSLLQRLYIQILLILCIDTAQRLSKDSLLIQLFIRIPGDILESQLLIKLGCMQ